MMEHNLISNANAAEWSAYVLSAVAIICALMMVCSRNPVNSVLYLVGTFFCISAHYLLLNAQFLAIVNIIVYAGAIMVLFLFVVMLINFGDLRRQKKRVIRHCLVVLLGAALLFLILFLLRVFNNTAYAPAPLDKGSIGHTQSLSELLFSTYALPFELTGILFLTAVIAGVLLAKKNDGNISEKRTS